MILVLTGPTASALFSFGLLGFLGLLLGWLLGGGLLQACLFGLEVVLGYLYVGLHVGPCAHLADEGYSLVLVAEREDGLQFVGHASCGGLGHDVHVALHGLDEFGLERPAKAYCEADAAKDVHGIVAQRDVGQVGLDRAQPSAYNTSCRLDVLPR